MPIESALFVVTRGDSIGGAQIHVRDMARALQKRGVRVAVAAGTTGALQAELEQSGIPHFLIQGLVRTINPLSDLLALKSLTKVIREFRPDLVSCHTAKAGLVGRLAAYWSGVPAVFTAHGWQFAEGIPLWQKLIVLAVEAVLSRMTRRVITVSGYDRNLALRLGLGSSRKIVLVHNGMPWREKPPAADSSGGPVRIVMVARFQKQKDHACLFAALEPLESLPWVLELVGDGPDLNRWKSWVSRRGWSGRVSFDGQRLDVPEILERCDVFVLSSRWEGFPRSTLEAMRASLPAVVSDVGGCREAVLDGKNGFLVPAGDAKALAGKLEALILDPELRRSLGSAGRLRYEEEFTFEAMLKRTIAAWG